MNNIAATSINAFYEAHKHEARIKRNRFYQKVDQYHTDSGDSSKLFVIRSATGRPIYFILKQDESIFKEMLN